MSRFSKGRNNAFFEQRSVSGIAIGGTKNEAAVVPRAFQNAKRTGTIQLSSLGLENIDPQLFLEDDNVTASRKEVNYSFDSQTDARFWEEITIQRIDMSFNRIRFIPQEIGNLTDLLVLNLRSNNILKFPAEICECVKLKCIDLGQNEVTSIPDKISSLIELRELLVNENRIDVLPDAIGGCTSLCVLNIDGNNIASLPESICGIMNLSTLVASRNRLTAVPELIGGIRSLILFDLHKNKIRRLPDLSGLSKLTHLDVRENLITDFPCISSSGALAQVLLGYNRISR